MVYGDFVFFGAIAGLYGKGFVAIEFEQVNEDLFALVGGTQHEFVGATLTQIGGVDEGVVVDFEVIVDLFLGGFGIFGGERAECTVAFDLKFEFAAFAASAVADDLKFFMVADELKVYSCVGRSGMDNVVFAAGAAFTPDRPGNRFEEGGFSGSV